ncbi:MAG TPA: nucleotidyltransferase domain-containing protein, partial [Casimicrobiaceae bacterium]|nr:nucleotidyltransferase domain-containing protein [Casimicrobiaceae bacterium]
MSTPALVESAPAAHADSGVAYWREELARGKAQLQRDFMAAPDTPRLLRGLARLTDRVLVGVWNEIGVDGDLALIAVGGFGRGQLYPHSDVDVLVLLPGELDAKSAEPVGRFFTTLWDIGIELGHAVRTLDECEQEMDADITVRTSLLESRRVTGSRRLYQQFRKRFAATLDVAKFYDAKVLEQQQRHLKYHDASSNLEPNVKESPGGLRDLQTVLWIARAMGVGRTWSDMARNGLLTMNEARSVSRQQRLIGALRVRLHYLAGRREDRLIFDQQTALARQIGLADT